MSPTVWSSSSLPTKGSAYFPTRQVSTANEGQRTRPSDRKDALATFLPDPQNSESPQKQKPFGRKQAQGRSHTAWSWVTSSTHGDFLALYLVLGKACSVGFHRSREGVHAAADLISNDPGMLENLLFWKSGIRFCSFHTQVEGPGSS